MFPFCIIFLFIFIHQVVRLTDGLRKGMHAADAADADGQVQLRMLRNDDPADRLPDLVLLPRKNMLVHLREQQ